MIEQHLPLVRALAQRFSHRGEQLDDLVQAGSLGLIKAVDRFDLGRGSSLAAYAIPTIVGEIRRHLRDSVASVRLPRGQQELAAGLARQRDSLAAEQRRTPTLAELAAAAALPSTTVASALATVAAARPAPLDESVEGAEDTQAAHRLELGVERVMLARGLRRLNPRERQIVQLRYFGDLSQRGIAAEVGLSQVHVSRLLNRSLGKLREEIGQA